MNFFSIHTIFFTYQHYSVSYLEFVGTIVNFLSVWLATRNNVWSWPIGNIGVVLFAILFYQVHIYAELIKQSYYLLAGFYGWWTWHHFDLQLDQQTISHNSFKTNGFLILLLASCVGPLGYFVAHVNQILPQLFTHQAALPYIDAFLVLTSFTATILMARKKIECWFYWILVNLLSIFIYFKTGILLASINYGFMLFLATKGLWTWKKLLYSPAFYNSDETLLLNPN